MGLSRILVVDDEEIIRQLLYKTLTKCGYEVEVAEDGVKALEKASHGNINLVITDLKMPKADGMSVLQEIKQSNPYVEVIVLTGYPTIEAAVAAIKVGAYDFLCKPFDIVELEDTVKKCLERQKFSIAHVEKGELEAFTDISRTVATVTTIDPLLEKILDTSLSMLKAENGALLLFDEESREFRTKATRGKVDAGTAEAGMKACQLGEGARDGNSLAAPLVTRSRGKERKLGAIAVSGKLSREDFTEREERLLLVLAADAVTSIENFQIYSLLQEKVALLEKTVKQLEEAQAQLIQSEKMAAVGQLAFGIAHEIRNPLGIILGGVDFLKGSLPENSEMISLAIDKIKHSVNRANTIILELLKFSRSAKLELRPSDLSLLMDEVAGLLKNQSYLNSVEIRKEYPSSGMVVNADPSLLRQAFFNLCSNAMDAMPQGGQLTLRIYQGSPNGCTHPPISVEISDTGKGIPEKIIGKVFDPFFTTKEPGKGTGLGLSIVHMIINRHNADISVKSVPDKGTTFSIRFPSEMVAAPEGQGEARLCPGNKEA